MPALWSIQELTPSRFECKGERGFECVALCARAGTAICGEHPLGERQVDPYGIASSQTSMPVRIFDDDVATDQISPNMGE